MYRSCSPVFVGVFLVGIFTAFPAHAVGQTESFVPEWAKRVVWYQIFPERFRNGDPSNDPTVSDLVGADPRRAPRQWQVHPWTSDWYRLQDYEIANGPSRIGTHLLRRRYGGDLQGIINQLDYLEELGVTAIYLNPIFTAPSLHKYDSACYHHVDPNFGPDPAGDRIMIANEDPLTPETWVWTKADRLALQLIREAHQRDMKIIFDGVFNHMGVNSFAFQDVLRNQQRSVYANWFRIRSWDDPQAGTTFDYDGWFGVSSLPELKEDENGIVQGPRQYIFDATERWMNPDGKGCQNGIDGWRLDVAYCVQHAFWKDWRKHVRSINPEAYLTAEIVKPPAEVMPYLQGDEFDGEMNYNFAFAAEEFFFQPGQWSISATQFDQKLKQLREQYPAGVAHVSQNLFGSHDSNRLGSHIRNRGLAHFRDWGNYFNQSKALSNPDYSPRKPNQNDIALQKLFVIFQMTYVGAPMIYYGDEVGMWGGNDPDCRKPMVWDDLNYESEETFPDQSRHEPDPVAVNSDLWDHYRHLIQIRNDHPALQLGDFQTLIADDARSLFGYRRQYQGQSVVVVLNNRDQSQTVSLPFLDQPSYRDVLNQRQHRGQDPVTLPPHWAIILTPEQ